MGEQQREIVCVSFGELVLYIRACFLLLIYLPMLSTPRGMITSAYFLVCKLKTSAIMNQLYWVNSQSITSEQ